MPLPADAEMFYQFISEYLDDLRDFHAAWRRGTPEEIASCRAVAILSAHEAVTYACGFHPGTYDWNHFAKHHKRIAEASARLGDVLKERRPDAGTAYDSGDPEPPWVREITEAANELRAALNPGSAAVAAGEQSHDEWIECSQRALAGAFDWANNTGVGDRLVRDGYILEWAKINPGAKLSRLRVRVNGPKRKQLLEYLANCKASRKGKRGRKKQDKAQEA